MKIQGKPVEDASESLVIEILPRDCKANRKNPGSCAAASAIMRTYDCKSVRVHISRTYLEMLDRWIRYITSDALRQEIIAFDRGGTFEPGVYTVNKPSGAQTLDYMALRALQKDSRTRHDNNKKQRPRHEVRNVRPRGV